jgi:hypothetical protein
MMVDDFGNTGDFGGRLPGDADGGNLLHAKNLFAALDSDPTAARMLHDAAKSVGDTYLDQTAAAIQDGHGHAEQHMAALGRLHAVMDVGRAAEYNDHQVDQYVHDKVDFDEKQQKLTFWGDFLGQVPIVEHAADFLKDGAVIGMGDGPQQQPTILSEFRGTDPAKYALLQNLYHRGVGDTSALAPLFSGQVLAAHQAFHDQQQGATWEAMRDYLNDNHWAIDRNDLVAKYGETYSITMHNGQPGVEQSRPNP